ncbi:uncharacterized protein LOC132278502 [Cornus florida]|uniref:uncharacterized protein LOC132278502 n=1 Tax=Cornus florida TaxID=4283 RepID=UPI00289FFCE2|nr:uncharacterized protein LOC132278502 [Cornus florida]
MVGGCYLLFNNPLVLNPERRHRNRASIRQPRTASSIIFASVGGNGISELVQKWRPNSAWQSMMVRSAPLIELGKRITVRPTPELGLLSLLFVLSMAVGAIFLLAVISIPTMSAFRRMAVSMDKLVQVASVEVPGTLSSLKLSGLEMNELTQQLTNLRQKISGNQHGKKYRKQ